MPGQDTATRAQQRPGAGRRLAAVTSLASLIAGAVLLLVGIVVHLAAALLAIIALLAGATGGWYAVSRRGAVRVIALAVAAAALAALGVGLFFEDISVWRTVLVLVLGGVSVLAARYALNRTRRQLRARLARLAVAEPPARPGPDHEPEVRRRQGGAVRPCRGVPEAGHRAGRPAARR